ncbi:MAG: flavodoxin [Succinivibrionaceae bacterium]
MSKIGIFYGSDTGNTENAATFMQEVLGAKNTDLFDVRKVKDPKIILNYDLLIFGTSTWHLGEMQGDMEQFCSKLSDINLTGKKVALFGLGDQIEYSDYFVDGMGKLYYIIKELGAEVIGEWPTEGYSFSSVLSLSEDNQHFIGLALDDDNQEDLTAERIVSWLNLITKNNDILN